MRRLRVGAGVVRIRMLATLVCVLTAVMSLWLTHVAKAARLPTAIEARAIFTAEFSGNPGRSFPGRFIRTDAYVGAVVSTADARFALASGSLGSGDADLETLLARPSDRSQDWRRVLELGGGPPPCSTAFAIAPSSVVRDIALCTTNSKQLFGYSGFRPYARRTGRYFAPETGPSADPILSQRGSHGTLVEASRAFGKPRLSTVRNYACTASWPNSHVSATVAVYRAGECRGYISIMQLGAGWYTNRGVQVGLSIKFARRLYPANKWPAGTGTVRFDSDWIGSHVGDFDFHQVGFGQAFLAHVSNGRIKSFTIEHLGGGVPVHGVAAWLGGVTAGQGLDGRAVRVRAGWLAVGAWMR